MELPQAFRSLNQNTNTIFKLEEARPAGLMKQPPQKEAFRLLVGTHIGGRHCRRKAEDLRL